MRNKNQKGFTLIELLVVVAIIGLLASVVLLALNSARARARDTKRVADMRQIQAAMELYLSDNPTVGYLSAAGPCPISTCLSALRPNYLLQIPSAPLPADGPAACTSGGGNTYTYVSGSNSTYSITFCLGSAVGTISTGGPHTLTPNGIE